MKFKDGVQGHYPAWETVFLVEASGVEEAARRAEELGRREEGDCGGSLRWEGRPATFVYAGVRKVTPVSHVRPGGVLGDGDELAFSEYRVADEEALGAWRAGGRRRSIMSSDDAEAGLRSPRPPRLAGLGTGPTALLGAARDGGPTGHHPPGP